MGEAGENVDEAEDDQPFRFSLSKVTCISSPALKTPWLPDCQNVLGVEFIRLNKWDKSLTRFCAGASPNRSVKRAKPLVNINVAWFHEIHQLRREGCNAALKKVMLESQDEQHHLNTPDDKIRAATEQDQWVAGRMISVSLPEVKGDDGATIAERRDVRLLWGIRGADIWMELSDANLYYIRTAIRASKPQDADAKRKAPSTEPGRKKRRKLKRRPSADAEQKQAENGEEPVEGALAAD